MRRHPWFEPPLPMLTLQQPRLTLQQPMLTLQRLLRPLRQLTLTPLRLWQILPLPSPSQQLHHRHPPLQCIQCHRHEAKTQSLAHLCHCLPLR
mmetsp:Transcript_13746/g.39251  ORF Transcript_13746/g.39251 Transcript_13746/m.39251 type:complete len:93 (+) Transcript_13746:583-861(+)